MRIRPSTLSLVTEVSGVKSWRARLVALGGLALVGLIYCVGARKTTDALSTEQPRASAVVGELVDSASVAQTFEVQYPGLSRVEVRLATYERNNTGQLIFRLQASGEDIVTRTLDVALVEDGEYHVFEFPPIRDSAGRSFRFVLEVPGAQPGNAVTVWGVDEDAYPDGEAVLRGLDGRGVRDLTFRLGYAPSSLERWKIAIDRLAMSKPSLGGEQGLYILLGIVPLVLSYLFLMKVAGMRGNG